MYRSMSLIVPAGIVVYFMMIHNERAVSARGVGPARAVPESGTVCGVIYGVLPALAPLGHALGCDENSALWRWRQQLKRGFLLPGPSDVSCFDK